MDSGATLEELEQRPDYDVQLESLNQWQLAWRRFKRHRMALLGSALFLFMVVVGLIGPTPPPCVPPTVPYLAAAAAAAAPSAAPGTAVGLALPNGD